MRRLAHPASAVLAALALAPAAVSAQVDAPACFDEFVLEKMDEGHMPGLAASIVRDGEVVWAKGFGLANVELGVPVTVDTPFFLASISKTVTGVALMQQRDLGALALDDDVNDYLHFPVAVPDHPGEPITFRQLLTHTSGVRDFWQWMDPQYVDGDSPLALGSYLPQYLAPGGSIYQPDQCYYDWAPGTTYAYANQGLALVGLLTQVVAGVDFAEYCEAAIFDPLGMQDTSFRLADFDPDTVAMPYYWNAGAGQYVAFGHHGYPDYPAGTLRSSVMDLSRWLLTIENDGSYGGAQVLAPASMQEMKTIQDPDVASFQGLVFYTQTIFGNDVLGHDGGDPGVLTDMYYRPSDGTGVILLTNGEANFGAYWEIYEALWDFADTFAIETVRLGTPPNPEALLPGVTTGPVAGSTWDPVVDHATFVPDATVDLLGVTPGGPANIPVPGLGTLLCDTSEAPLFVFPAAPGAPFAVPIPDDCQLLGRTLASQAASSNGTIVQLTNALDVTVGAF